MLGLRSTWFSIGVLRLNGAGRVRQGQARTLRVLTRDLANVRLQRKVGSGSWVDLRAVQGSVNVVVRPSQTTLYRLTSPAATGAAVKVTVTGTSTRIAAPAEETGALEFAMGTAAPGEAVQVQRRVEGDSWMTVATATAGEDGTWRTIVCLTPGAYRAVTVSASGVQTAPTLAFG